jgi:hypothetical protein
LLCGSQVALPGFPYQRKAPFRFFNVVVTQERNIGFADHDAAGSAALKLEVYDRRRISRLVRNYVFLLRRMQVPPGQEAPPVKVVSADPEVADFCPCDGLHTRSF